MVQESPAPTGFYHSTREWLEKCFDERKRKNYCRDIYLEVPGPPGLKGGPTPWIPPWYPEGFAAVIPGGRVMGRSGAIVTPDDKVLLDLSFDRVADAECHPVFREGVPPPQVTPETVAVLTHVGSSGFYEWFYLVLARLDLIERTGISIDQYLVNHSNLPFQLESLGHLGMDGKVTNTSEGLHLKAGRLVVPSVPSYTAKWACDYLRDRLLFKRNVPELEGPERIYVSREQAPRRRVVNDDEVQALLTDHGFETVLLETMTLSRQIQIFLSAKAIVAPHGAGLTNLTFCRPATKVIEFFSPNWIDPCYWYISKFLNLDYRYMMGTGVRPEAFRNLDPYWGGADDILVDTRELLACIRSAGLA